MTLSVVGQRLYTHSASDAKKIDQLRRNTRFSFYIDDGAGSVHFVHGRAAFTDDIEEKDGVFKSNELIRTYFSAPDDRNFCVLRLWVETIDAYNEDGVLESWRNPEFPPNG